MHNFACSPCNDCLDWCVVKNVATAMPKYLKYLLGGIDGKETFHTRTDLYLRTQIRHLHFLFSLCYYCQIDGMEKKCTSELSESTRTYCRIVATTGSSSSWQSTSRRITADIYRPNASVRDVIVGHATQKHCATVYSPPLPALFVFF